MSLEGILVVVLVVSALVGAVAFWIGDQRRRIAGGQDGGPRPRPSIGDALALASREGRWSRVVVVFLGEGGPSEALGAALAGDPDVRRALDRRGFHHVVVRSDPDIRRHLYEKYAGEAAPAGPACLLLGADGALLEATEPPAEGAAAWLRDWLERSAPSPNAA